MKTNKIIMLISLFLLGMTTAFAQVKEDRKVSSFEKIKVSAGIHVKYTQGEKYSVTVEAENQKIIDAIASSVEENTLMLTTKRNSDIRTNKGITIYVTCPILNTVHISSGSRFTAEELYATKELYISTSSGSAFNVKYINTPKRISIKSSSGSSCSIAELKAQEANLSTSSGSSSKIAVANISGNLNIECSSGSSTKIQGKADEVNLSASAGSSINIENLTHKKINSNKDKSSSIKQ